MANHDLFSSVPPTEADILNSTNQDNHKVVVTEDRKFYLILIAIGVLGTLSNSFVVLVIRKFTTMTRKISGVLILNQSVMDSLGSFLFICDNLVVYCYGFGLPGGRDGRMLYCRIVVTKWLQWGLLYSSTWNLLVVNVERYFSVVWPIFHKKFTFKNFALPAIVIVWIYWPVFNLIWAQVSTYMEDDQCMLYAFHGDLQLSMTYNVSLVVPAFYMPLALMIYFYCHMICVLRSRKSKAHQKNLFKTLMIVSLAFIACWAMGMVCWTLYNSGVLKVYTGELYYSSFILVNLNACVNPFIYIINYHQFKAGVRKMMSRGQVAQDSLSGTGTSRSTTVPHLNHLKR